jgi:hypothetical protein
MVSLNRFLRFKIHASSLDCILLGDKSCKLRTPCFFTYQTPFGELRVEHIEHNVQLASNSYTMCVLLKVSLLFEPRYPLPNTQCPIPMAGVRTWEGVTFSA